MGQQLVSFIETIPFHCEPDIVSVQLGVGFEWDPNKARENHRRHGVQFSTEVPDVFSDEMAITVIDDGSQPDEQRFVALGMGANGKILVVVYCYRGEAIRIISARPANPSECSVYEANR